MSTSIVKVDNVKLSKALQSSADMQDVINEVTDYVAEYPADMTSKKGIASIKTVANNIAKTKTTIDGFGKDMVKEIQANRKLCVKELDQLKVDYRKPLTDLEDAQKVSKAQIAGLGLIARDVTVVTPVVQIENLLATLAEFDHESIHESLKQEALDAVLEATTLLEASLVGAKAYEAEQAELEELRKLKADADKVIADALKEKAVKPVAEAKPEKKVGMQSTGVLPDVSKKKEDQVPEYEDWTERELESIADLKTLFDFPETIFNAIKNGAIRNVSFNRF